MIGYRISQAELEALIEAKSEGWLAEAATRTDGFRQSGRYEEPKSIWGKVKPVYMKLQGDAKCAYCERKLESIDLGKAEQDVEHFRPKGRVRQWKVPKEVRDQGVKATAVPAEPKGYHLLPYHPFNYASACKPCNQSLKRDYFPVAARYDLAGADPDALRSEMPYLIYPLGQFDSAPEDLIRFYGVSPQPVAPAGHARARAIVTIAFFKLDDEAKRKNLLRERAFLIVALNAMLEKLADGAAGKARIDAQTVVDGFISPTSAHTNCARSFKRLFESDRADAQAVCDRAVAVIKKGS